MIWAKAEAEAVPVVVVAGERVFRVGRVERGNRPAAVARMRRQEATRVRAQVVPMVAGAQAAAAGRPAVVGGAAQDSRGCWT